MKDNIYYNLKEKNYIDDIFIDIYNIFKTLIYTGKNIKLFLKIIKFHKLMKLRIIVPLLYLRGGVGSP